MISMGKLLNGFPLWSLFSLGDFLFSYLILTFQPRAIYTTSATTNNTNTKEIYTTSATTNRTNKREKQSTNGFFRDRQYQRQFR